LEKEIKHSDLMKVALKVKADFFKPNNSAKTTVFLCGGDLNKKNTLRAEVAIGFGDWLGKYYYDIIYPEDIFEELLFSSKSTDLLSLENMLADSVDVILIIPESPGSFAELGAFANNEKLRKKIVCLIDPKFKKHKSFINQGPVKLIKESNKTSVLYVGKDNLHKEFNKIKASLRKIKSNSTKVNNKIGLLQLDKFLLPLIYLSEPLSKKSLVEVVKEINEDKTNPFNTTTVALSMLTKRKLIEFTIGGYRLTDLGSKKFINLQKSRIKAKSSDETEKLDETRLEILNLQYRGKKLKV